MYVLLFVIIRVSALYVPWAIEKDVLSEWWRAVLGRWTLGAEILLIKRSCFIIPIINTPPCLTDLSSHVGYLTFFSHRAAVHT